MNAADWKQDDLKVTSVNLFFKVMKAIAKEDLWDEYEALLSQHGHKHMVFSLEQIHVLQGLIDGGAATGKGRGVGQELMVCIFCPGSGRVGGPNVLSPADIPHTPPAGGSGSGTGTTGGSGGVDGGVGDGGDTD